MQNLTETLSKISIFNAQPALNLTVFPLVSPHSATLNYLTLAEAVSSGVATVREKSSTGSVPEILVENHADNPILILDGEELVGAKQNRTVNITILAPAGKTTSIPVTCIEAGRWSSGPTKFDVAARMHYARGRAMKMENVSAAMAVRESRAADQSEVWDQIARKSERMRVQSATSALSDVFESHKSGVEDYVRRLQTESGQIGAVFAIDGRIEGLELFDAPATFRKMFESLVRSYALDALETCGGPRAAASKDHAAAFVRELAGAETREYSAIGLGEEIRIDARGLIAGGLRVDDVLVHLVAFRKSRIGDKPRQTRSSMLQASLRRRNRDDH